MGFVTIKNSVIKKYLQTVLTNGDSDMLTEALELLKEHTGAHYTLVVDAKVVYTTVENADHRLHIKKQVKKGIAGYMQYTPFMKLYKLKYGIEFATLLVEYEHTFSLDRDVLSIITLIARIATYREQVLNSYLTDKVSGLPNRDAVIEVFERKKSVSLAYIKVCNRKELVMNAGVECYDKMVQSAAEVLLRNQSNVFRTSVDSFSYLLQSDTSSSFLFLQDILEQVECETDFELSACITPVGDDVRFALYLCESYEFTVPKDICILRDIRE